MEYYFFAVEMQHYVDAKTNVFCCCLHWFLCLSHGESAVTWGEGLASGLFLIPHLNVLETYTDKQVRSVIM